jgi:hypothetical protein
MKIKREISLQQLHTCSIIGFFSHTAASSTCRANGMSLPTIHSDLILKELSAMHAALSKRVRLYWIGGKRVNGVWQEVTPP